jgi:hypothetical protein
MKIKRMDFPETSILFPERKKYDYIDSFGGIFHDKENKIGIEDIGKAFLKPLPGWIDALMNLRNLIVRIVGLKRSSKAHKNLDTKNIRFDAGEKIGFFNVYNRTDYEVILGEDDKHLNFRISLLLDCSKHDPTKKAVILTTVVTYNNWMGPVYFFFVKPLHRLIVPAMMKKDYDHLEK